MVNVTKNQQGEATIINLVKNAFPHKEMIAFQELTEGFFNIAYEISFGDGSKSILKIAPHPDVLVMTYELNIMRTEVQVMKLVREQTTIPVPEVQYYDDSCVLCSSAYFFMNKITGRSLSSQKAELSADVVGMIQGQVGAMNRKINEMHHTFFGYPGNETLQGNNWHEVFFAILRSVVLDAKKVHIDVKIDTDELLQLLEKSKEQFADVITPQLVHWDIWDGNIFVDDNEVTGIIDWERALWADPLMEVGFRYNAQSAEFLHGYGMDEFTANQRCRILWYDIYLLLIMAQENVYRQYDTVDFYQWATKRLPEKYAELKAEILSERK